MNLRRAAKSNESKGGGDRRAEDLLPDLRECVPARTSQCRTECGYYGWDGFRVDLVELDC